MKCGSRVAGKVLKSRSRFEARNSCSWILAHYFLIRHSKQFKVDARWHSSRGIEVLRVELDQRKRLAKWGKKESEATRKHAD